MLYLLLIVANVPQIQNAEERHAAYMAAALGFSADIAVTERTINGVGKGRIELQAPNMQKFTLSWAGEDFEFRHSRLGGIAIRRDWKEYHESNAFLFNPMPSPLMLGNADLGYPSILAVPTLKDFSRGAEWQNQGTETIRGKRCDKLYISLAIMQLSGKHTVWIDQQGKILRWRREMQTAEGPLDVRADYTNHSQSSPTDIRRYDMTLPIGFVPATLPSTRTSTLRVAAQAIFGNWNNVRKGTHEDVAELVTGVPVVIVFTDPDCEISNTLEPYLVKLRTRLKKEGCALIEVSLGRKQPDLAGKDVKRPVYWDQVGSIEAAYGTPGTPYFLLASKDGQLVRGWQGYSKKKELEITKELLRAFEN